MASLTRGKFGMSGWIKVDQAALDDVEHHSGRLKGVEITIGLSPNDIPEKVRGRYGDHGEYIIEFKYLCPTREARMALEKHQLVEPVVGIHSGRIYEIRIYGVLKAEGIVPQVQAALDHLKADHRFANRSRHYEIAQEAVTGTGRALLPAF